MQTSSQEGVALLIDDSGLNEKYKTWKDFTTLDLPYDESAEQWAENLAQAWIAAKEELIQTMKKFPTVSRAVQANEDLDLSAFDAKLEALSKMKELGAQLSPQHFVVALTALHPRRRLSFLQSLSFELSKDDWIEWRDLQKEEQAQSTIVPYRLLDSKQQRKWPWKHSGNEMVRLMNFVMDNQSGNAETAIHWMPATMILDPVTASDEIRILKALHSTGAESGAFATPIGWSILTKVWSRYAAEFWWSRFLDVCFLVLFAIISYYTVFCKTGAPKIVLVLTSLLTLRSLINPFVEFIGVFCEFSRCSEAFANSCTLWNLGLFSFEIFNGVVIIPLLYSEYLCQEENCGTSSFTDHPVVYSIVVGSRWIYLVMSLLCVEVMGFGRNVFPAWHAMTRPASLSFILFLMLAVFGALQAYLSFPIPENNPYKGSFWLAFMKVFRFALLGDFDVWELEGVDPVIKGDIAKSGTMTAALDDGEASLTYHDGVMLFVMFLGITVTILSMNVAIGVVGSLYDEAKAVSLQIQSHYKAGYVFKMQLINSMKCRACCKFREREKVAGSDDLPDCFLCSVATKDIEGDPKTSEEGAQILEKVNSLEKDLKSLEAKMDQILQAVTKKP
eukprot:TRINITY_DN36016_c0_g1_i1.p1 TRINITY_DN36016_c0_g1~~TRINITY_DN36016_c0_g1_i1.p1  ORF type:complete len:616 (-),score=83.22 TRINITY_DN36016_c0_g1_i1:161-2008(-)